MMYRRMGPKELEEVIKKLEKKEKDVRVRSFEVKPENSPNNRVYPSSDSKTGDSTLD